MHVVPGRLIVETRPLAEKLVVDIAPIQVRVLNFLEDLLTENVKKRLIQKGRKHADCGNKILCRMILRKILKQNTHT